MRRHRHLTTLSISGAVIAVLILLFLGRPTGMASQGNPQVTQGPADLILPSAQESGSLDEESYLLLDVDSGRVITARNTELKRPPASTTKLLTGLVAQEILPPEHIVEVGEEVYVEGSKLGLQPGDRISVHDLLTAMYVMSANDAAAALAVEASGSIAAFAQEMNAYATLLGANNSNFVNPHGLSDPNHYTTASDLARIAYRFIQNENLLNYVNQDTAQITWVSTSGQNRSATIQNTNKLLGIYPGVEGLKTGTTQDAGQCLVTYLVSEDGRLLLVLLGSKQRYYDTVDLLDEGIGALRLETSLETIAKDPQTVFNSPGLFAP